jgi:SPP1 family predicted phage head-tail adaptor
MRFRGQIQKPITTQNSYGQKVITWQTMGNRWISVIPLTGKELFSAFQVNALLTHTITMRVFPDISPRWRIKHCDRIFNIQSIATDLEMLTLMCVEEE